MRIRFTRGSANFFHDYGRWMLDLFLLASATSHLPPVRFSLPTFSSAKSQTRLSRTKLEKWKRAPAKEMEQALN